MVTIVNDDTGDWLGVYLDGRLVYENHSVTPARLLEAVGLPVESLQVDLEAHGMTRCPSDLGTLQATIDGKGKEA